MVMNDSEKHVHNSRLLNMRMAIVEVEIAETNEEAWLRHLIANPESAYANIKIFNRQKPGGKLRDHEIIAPETITKSW